MASAQTEQRIKKQALLVNLSQGVSVVKACKAANLGRTTFYTWIKEDPLFREEVSLSEAASISSIEDALWLNGMKGNVTAQIFFLLNRAPDRWKDTRYLNPDRPFRKLTDEELQHEIDSSIASLPIGVAVPGEAEPSDREHGVAGPADDGGVRDGDDSASIQVRREDTTGGMAAEDNGSTATSDEGEGPTDIDS